MAKCHLGPKKIRKIKAILGPGFEVHAALVRGGWPHFDAECWVTDRGTGEEFIIDLNYKTGVIHEQKANAVSHTTLWSDRAQ